MRTRFLITPTLITIVTIVTVHAASAEQHKLVIADYFAHHVSRLHDGQIGPWSLDKIANQSKAEKTHFVYNADLLDRDDRHCLAALAHPLLGLQSDMDPDYQEFQILLAKVAHIDGFVLEWAFPGDASADSILRSMMVMARRYDFRLGVNWIEGSFFDWLPGKRDDVETREDCLREYGRAIEYLMDDIYQADVGIIVDGHPLVLLFSGPNAPNPEEFAAVLETVRKNRHGNGGDSPAGRNATWPWFLKRGGVGTKESHAAGYFNKWAPCIDGTFGWVSVHSNQKPTPIPLDLQGKVDHYLVGDHMTMYLDRLRNWNQRYVDAGTFSFRMQAVCPGFDNRGCAGWGRDLAYLGREEGEHYRRQWQQHIEHRDQIDAVLVVTWNDFSETTVVEPTVEFGYREIATTQEYAARFKGLTHDPAGLGLPERLFSLRKDQAWLARTGFDTSDATSQLDQAGLHIASRQYTQAATLLAPMEAQFAVMHSQTIQEAFSLELDQGLQTTGQRIGEGGTFPVKRANPLTLRVDEEIASKLRKRNFDATLSFQYLDQGTGRVQVAQVPIPRPVDYGLRHNAKFWEVCDIHQTDTGQWLPARVRIYKQTAALNHKGLDGADFAFLTNTSIRNIRIDVTTHRRDPR